MLLTVSFLSSSSSLMTTDHGTPRSLSWTYLCSVLMRFLYDSLTREEGTSCLEKWGLMLQGTWQGFSLMQSQLQSSLARLRKITSSISSGWLGGYQDLTSSLGEVNQAILA